MSVHSVLMSAVIPFKKEVPGFVRPPDLPFTCTDERLLDAVQSYLMGYDEKEVARLLHIPQKSIRHWITSKGWKFIEDSLRDTVRKAVVGQTTRLANKMLARMEEQLEKGNPIYDMEGNEIGRRAIGFKDLSSAYSLVVSKQIELEKKLVGDGSKPANLNDFMNWLKEEGAKREKVIEASP